MVVVVPVYPCHTPVRGKTTPKIRNPHHIKPFSTSPNNKNNSNRAENFSLSILRPAKSNSQLSANSVVWLLRYSPPGTKSPQFFSFHITPNTLPLSLTYPPPTVPLRSLPPYSFRRCSALYSRIFITTSGPNSGIFGQDQYPCHSNQLWILTLHLLHHLAPRPAPAAHPSHQPHHSDNKPHHQVHQTC